MLYRRRIIPRRLVELWEICAATRRRCGAEGDRAFARVAAPACVHDGSPRRCSRSTLSVRPLPRQDHSPNGSIIRMYRLCGSPKSTASTACTSSFFAYTNFSSSDFRPGAVPGSIVDGVRSEDLTRLTYPDASFDLVLTSETLEHVPDLAAALAEIRRVLVPGGRHIFTIPQLPHVPTTFARSIVLADGSIEDRAPRICHPGGDVGYPVFTEFGADIADVFERGGLRGSRCSSDRTATTTLHRSS